MFDVDSDTYNAGRAEGRADIVALLRRLVDPENAFHWNAGGVLRAVAILAGRSADETSATMKEAGYSEESSTPTGNTATVVKVYGEYARAPDVLQAVLIKTDAPVMYGGNRSTHYIYAVAARQAGTLRAVVRVYCTDGREYVLSDAPLIEKTGTRSIRVVLADAGYDISAWPKEVI